MRKYGDTDLNEYQQHAATQDALYFPHGRPIEFYALCLAGEAGEAVDELKKLVFYTNHRNHTKDKLRSELGDVLWSLARLADMAGLSLQDIANAHAIKLAETHGKPESE